jgi:hypothetical protein
MTIVVGSESSKESYNVDIVTSLRMQVGAETRNHGAEV